MLIEFSKQSIKMTVKPLSEKTFTEQFTTLTIKDQLLSLPKEIWLHAASFLNKSEIKNLALASKAHLPLAKKALNDLEKTTALHELIEINTLDPQQPESLVSCLSIYQQILHKLHEDHLLNMNPSRAATLIQHLSALTTREATKRLRELHQTLAHQIDTGQVYIDMIEISYADIKAVLLIEALLEIVSVATNPQQARSLALKIAINANCLKIAKALITIGNITLGIRSGAVECAAKNGHLEIVQAVLASGEISEYHRGCAVQHAAEDGHLEIVQALLAHGVISKDDRSRAVKNAAEKNHVKIVQFLLANGVISEYERGEAVQKAAKNGYLEVVQALLPHSVISEHDRGWAVIDAAKMGHTAVVQALLENGVISEEDRGWAVKEAVENGHLEILQALLAHRVISEDDRFFGCSII